LESESKPFNSIQKNFSSNFPFKFSVRKDVKKRAFATTFFFQKNRGLSISVSLFSPFSEDHSLLSNEAKIPDGPIMAQRFPGFFGQKG